MDNLSSLFLRLKMLYKGWPKICFYQRNTENLPPFSFNGHRSPFELKPIWNSRPAYNATMHEPHPILHAEKLKFSAQTFISFFIGLKGPLFDVPLLHGWRLFRMIPLLKEFQLFNFNYCFLQLQFKHRQKCCLPRKLFAFTFFRFKM